ncbi:MAG: pantoate--beta-alanine ligase [Actinomycetaceae bacterium]|nr:pantoate--beta-alanine ligase [Actinomycetaceae bacterium]
MTLRPALVHTRSDFLEARSALIGTTALVMTMGALHEGHLSLVRRVAEMADNVIVTIFVNPTQFAPGEDFDAYPRTLDADIEALSGTGATLVWAPSNEDIYGGGTEVTIDAGAVARILEGATRPTHFAGVALVVTKVLNIIRPDIAIFGQKDAQQLAVLRQVVADLDIPVRIIAGPIMRDSDGVALSSRNQYLTADQRVSARALVRSLRAGSQVASSGGSAIDCVRTARDILISEGGVDIDYVALVEDATFTPILVAKGNAVDIEEAVVANEPGDAGLANILADSNPLEDTQVRLLVAARVGATRLIDNDGFTLHGQG